jgi:O-antigen/teichoic acid export membrane protein
VNEQPGGLTLRANFSWTFAGSVVYAAAQWGMLVVLTKLGSPEMVGMFALGLAVTMPVMSFATLKTRLVQATDARRDYQFGHYWGLRLLTTAVALPLIGGIAIVAGYESGLILVILAVALSKAVESLGDVLYGLFQQRERMDLMAISRLLKGPLALIALGVGVHLTGSLLWGILGLTLAWLVVLAAYDLPHCARLLQEDGWLTTLTALRPRWEVQQLAQLAWLALPLGIVVTLESLATNIPRYFIEREAGVYLLGIFAAIAYLKRAGQTIVIALGLSATPRLARQYMAGDTAAYRHLLQRLTGIGALLGLGGLAAAWLFGKPLLTLLYRPEYAAYQSVFALLMLAAGVDYVAIFLDYGMTAARQFRWQMGLFIGVVAVETLVCTLLVPRGALLGAATAVLTASIVRALGGWVVVRRAITARRAYQNAAEPVLTVNR